ncbi:MAG: hypothetical protein OEU36_13595 [Gammaproteobacteria bacterium]|nr:hypothetical protein [Gammaproteobacteria bacterium]
MRKVSEVISVVALSTLVSITLWSVVRDWTYLTSVGGWFAVLGQTLAVITALAMIVIVIGLALALLALPVLLYFLAIGRMDEYRTFSQMLHLMIRTIGAQLRTFGGRILMAVDYGWKLLWWGHWYMRSFVRNCLGR